MDTAFAHKSQGHKQQHDAADEAHGTRPMLERPGGEAAGMPLFLQRVMDAPMPEEEDEATATVQTKLVVGDKDDAYEQEADQVAEAVVRRSPTPGVTPLGVEEEGEEPIQRLCNDCQSEEENPIQRKTAPTSPLSQPSVSGVEIPDAGFAMPDHVREQVEPVVGADLSAVRIHTSSSAQAAAKGLNAKAFIHQQHIWLGPGQSAADVELLAHESAHVVQQSSGGRVAVQRWSDPTASSLTAEDVAIWSETDLLDGLRALLDQVSPVDRSVAESDPATSDRNLHLIIVTAVSNSIDIPDDLIARLPEKYGPHPDTFLEMFARLDLMAAMLQREFPDQAPPIALRLDHYRKLYPWLDAIALEQAKLSLDASLTALETAARIHRVARDPGGDPEVTAAIGTLDVALANLLGALLTQNLPSIVAEVESARDAWLGQLVESFSRTITGVRDKISTPLDPGGYGYFSRGTPEIATLAGGRVKSEAMYDTIAALEQIRKIDFDALNKLGAEVPGASVPLEARLEFIATQSSRLDELLALAERVLLGVALCQQGQLLADAIYDSYQINQENFDGLAAASRALFNLVVVDYTRAKMPELRQRVEAALKRSDERLESIRSYEQKVTWFVNIAATLLGIGVMRAVMAIRAVAGLGRTGATIVGSLAFTTTRIAATNNQGKPLSAGGFLEDAAKDYFLLRLLGGVDARIVARVGDTSMLAAAARIGGTYGTLVAWTLTWNAIQPDAPGPTGAHGTSTGDVMVQTGVDLAALLIAEALLRAPAIPSTELTAPRDIGAGKKASREWDALRQEMETHGKQLREWLKGTRDDITVGDSLLEQATRLFARTKSLHARFAEIGEITDVQRAQLDSIADAMQESIRNARDELRLDVRSVTAESWSYRGSNENIAAYLERLKTQGRVQEVTPEGNGIFSARGSDGVLHWFFPAGRNAPAVLDLVAESVQASAPGVSEATRSQALVHLRGANWHDLGTFAGGLPTGRGAPFIEWVARSDVGEAIANDSVPMEVMRAISQSAPEQLDPIARGSAHPLPAWYKAWIARRPSGSAHDFITDLLDIFAWRGSMEVSGVQEAGDLLNRRAGAVPLTNLRFEPLQPGFNAAGPQAPVYSELITRALKGERIAGANYSEAIMGFVGHFVIEKVSGQVTRMFKVAPDGSILQRVPVTSHMATLRDVLFKVEGAPNEVEARAELAKSDPLLHDLDPLLDFREGVPVEQIHLIDALATHPLRSTPLAQPALPPAPAAPVVNRPRRRIVVTSGTPRPRDASEAEINLDQPSKLARRPGEKESAFVDRVIEAQERAYQKSIIGRVGGPRENPSRWARIKPRLDRLVAAMRNMQARLQRANLGHLLPEIIDTVLQTPIDIFVMRNPALRQARLDIEARLRENAAESGKPLSESPEWNNLQEFLGRTGNPKWSMEAMEPDIVEFLLDEGVIHISDVTTQLLDPLSVHAFKTRVYVEIMRSIVGPKGPKVSGQDIEMHADPSGKRVDPTRTRFGDIIE
jgi:hypothetical protein